MKERAVSIWLFVALFASVLLVRYLMNVPVVSIVTVINCSYLILLMVILLGYFRIRFKSWAILKKGLGLGDIVFWAIIAFLLSPQIFLFWFNSSMIIALIIHLVCSRFQWYGQPEKLPLAGIQSFFLIPFLFFNA